MPLSKSNYDDPVTAVFLRILAWELYVAEGKPSVKDATEQLQTARKELGLEELKGGAPRTFVQKLRPKGLLTAKNEAPEPLEKGWRTEWRLLYLPPHNLVRQLSNRPVFAEEPLRTPNQSYKEYLLTLRDPAVPTLRVFVGTAQPKANTFNRRRGLYFLRPDSSLYVGKTDEFDVRLPQHIKIKNPAWWVFITPEDSTQMFTLDALAAAEALAISFWGETSVLDNGTRGGDQKPASIFLQQAVLFAEAASAALLWLVCEQKSIGLSLGTPLEIPFKPWRGQSWPQCYLG